MTNKNVQFHPPLKHSGALFSINLDNWPDSDLSSTQTEHQKAKAVLAQGGQEECTRAKTRHAPTRPGTKSRNANGRNFVFHSGGAQEMQDEGQERVDHRSCVLLMDPAEQEIRANFFMHVGCLLVQRCLAIS